MSFAVIMVYCLLRFLNTIQSTTSMITDLIKSHVGRFRIVAFLEGMSFLILLGIAMPLKYMAGKPEAVQVVGMAHGVLFVLYVLMVFQVRSVLQWSVKQTFIALAASVLPFGTFYVDARMLRPTGEPQQA